MAHAAMTIVHATRVFFIRLRPLSVLVAALVMIALAVPSAATAQGSTKVSRVGVLESWAPASFPDRLAAFKQGLRDLGYVEGENLVVEYRSSGGRVAELPALAAELARLNVDVIFAATTAAAVPARRATSTIPIVMAVVADPIGVELIASLSRPGGNVTGLTTRNVELVPKRLEILKAITGDRATRIAMVYNPDDPSNVLALASAQEAARALAVELRPAPVRSAKALEQTFATLSSGKTDAVLVSAGALMDSHAVRIVELAARARIPALYSAREFVEAGGLVSYAASFAANYRRAATYVDRILKGARPADLPVEQSSTFEFVINTKAARALGLTVPPSLLLRADRVIE